MENNNIPVDAIDDVDLPVHEGISKVDLVHYSLGGTFSIMQQAVAAVDGFQLMCALVAGSQ